MKFELPDLPYAYDALEPFIDSATMKLHHDKHHATYVSKLNEALEGHPELQGKTLEELLISLDDIPADIRGKVRNHGGGHHNHSMFWKLMKPQGGEVPAGLSTVIAKKFGSVDEFKKSFSDSAKNIFGSGWAWLVIDRNKGLEIMTTPNQDSPLMSAAVPILGLDVWEHAYYLKYQNRRPEYVEAWWNVVNWEQVFENFTKYAKR
jgi:superoxide dismutase, Fe-Mn family